MLKKLDDLFTDIFELKKITNGRLTTFANVHLMSLVKNNPGGAFDALIPATQNALNALRQSGQGKFGTVGDRKAMTKEKKKARVAFNKFIRQKEGLVRGKFGERSEAYIQFFPQGLTAYDRATDMEYQLLLKNIVERATQYEADLGVDFKTEATNLSKDYVDAGNEQRKTKGKLSGFIDEISKERAELTKQLTFNALFIAATFLLQPEKTKVYFHTSLLFPQHRKHRHKGKPAPGSTGLVCKIVFEHGKYVWMKNKGAAVLTFQMFQNNEPVGNSFTVGPGEELRKRMDEFATNADELRVTNLSESVGMYQVTEVA